MALCLGHCTGENIKISLGKRWMRPIGKLKIIAYRKQPAELKLVFHSLNSHGRTLERKIYDLTGEKRACPFKDLRGHRKLRDGLSIYLSNNQEGTSRIKVIYDAPGFVSVLRYDAKKRNP
jgi:hypothetical protein